MAASGAKLATGWLELTVSTKDAQKSITDSVVPGAKKAGDQAGQSIGAQLLGGMKKFAGPIAALVAGFSVVSLVKNSEKAFMDLVGATNALQRIAGGTKEQVSGLSAAMQLSGVDAEKAQGALTIFSKNLGNASADGEKARVMAEKLGTSFLDAAGNVKPMSEILPGLSDKFKSMPDGAEKTALATQLFGRSGAQMLPFLNKGSAAIGELTDKAKQMGLVVDDVSGKAFAKAKVSQREYAMSLQGLMVTIGGNFLPITTAFGNVYRQSIIPVIQAATGFLAAHRAQFIAVGDGIQAFADRAGAAISGLIGFFAAGDSTFDLATALGLSDTSGVVAALLFVRESMQSVAASLGPVFAQIGAALGPTFAAIGSTFSQLAPVFGQLIPPLLTLWQSLSPVSLLFQALTPILPQVVSLVGTLATALGGALVGAVLQIAPPLVQVASVLVGALSAGLQAILPAVAQFATLLGGVLAQAISIIAPVLVQIVTLLGDGLTQVLTLISPLLTQLAPIFGQIMAAISPLVAAILQLISPLLELIGPILQPLIQLFMAILTPILGLIQPILGLLVPALQFVATVLSTVITWVAQAITWLVQFVTGNQQAGAQFQTVWSNIMGFFQQVGRTIASIWNGMISGISSFVGQVIGFFTSIPQKIGQVFAGAGRWLYDAGKNIVEGLINGAGSLLRNIGNFFLNLVPDWIKGPFMAALGINSPSRVFYGYGDNTIQGYIDGVKNRRADVQREINAAVPTLSPQSARVQGAGFAETISAALDGLEPGVTVQANGLTTAETAAEIGDRIEQKRKRRIRRSGALRLAGVK